MAPIADLVYNSDIAYPGENCGCGSSVPTVNPIDSKESTCNCGNPIWVVPPPPHHHHCHPDFPPYPPYPPYVPPIDPVPVKEKSKEAQICKLSKKSATVKKLIENFTEKNKDVIFKIGDASYNFGSYKVISKDEQGQKVEEDSVYGETILSILNDELAAIKEKIQELAAELDDDDVSVSDETDKTVTQD